MADKTIHKPTRKAASLRSWLDAIRDAHPQKLLTTQRVVAAARDPKSPGHRYFTWDDKKAAHRWRLDEAERLIRKVYVINQDSGAKTPAFVSLLPDREKPGGGYRATAEVLSSKALRAQLELTAKAELRAWTERYQILTGLVSAVAKAAGIEGRKRK